MNFVALRALIRNDLRVYTTDRRAMILGVLVPILIAAFFGYVFGGTGNRDVARIPVAVVDEDRSEVSHVIVAGLSQDPLMTVQVLERPQAELQVRTGKAQVAIVLPVDFAVDATGVLSDGQWKHRATVEFLIDPSQTLSSRVAEEVLVRRALQAITASAARTGQRSDGLREFNVPYATSITPVTSGSTIPYNGYAHSFAGMTVQFMLLAGIDAGIVLLLLRERGIWQRVRVAPLGKAQFLLARTISTMLISTFQFTLIYAAAIAIFGVRIEGSVVGFALMGIGLCFMNSTFGLMLASIGRSAAATRGIAVFVTLLLVMIGGAWVPSFIFPKWLQQASLISPTRWAVDGLDAMTWRGQGFGAALSALTVLCATAMICLGIAIWRFRWED